MFRRWVYSSVDMYVIYAPQPTASDSGELARMRASLRRTRPEFNARYAEQTATRVLQDVWLGVTTNRSTGFSACSTQCRVAFGRRVEQFLVHPVQHSFARSVRLAKVYVGSERSFVPQSLHARLCVRGGV